MKKGIHPNYHEIDVVMTDGSTFKTRSTMKAKKIVLDVDSKSHPAYTGSQRDLARTTGQMERFRKRFGNVNMKDVAERNKKARRGK